MTVAVGSFTDQGQLVPVAGGPWPIGLTPRATLATTGTRTPRDQLTVHDGNITLSPGSPSITGLNVLGSVSLATGTVPWQASIDDCWIAGYQITAPVGESANALIKAHTLSLASLTVADCTLIPDHPSPDWDGIYGHDFTLRRCLIAHTTDGIGAQNRHDETADWRIEVDGCYVDHLAFWGLSTGTSNVPPQTHNDAMQILGGGSISIYGGTWLGGYKSMPAGAGHDDPFGYVGQGGEQHPPGGTNVGWPSPASNSAIQFGSSEGAPHGFTIHDTYLGGGQATVNGAARFTASTMFRCRFDKGANIGYALIGAAGLDVDLATVLYDDGTPIRWRH